MFFHICLLELRNYVLRMIGIPRSGFLEITLNQIPYQVFRFLPRSILEKRRRTN